MFIGCRVLVRLIANFVFLWIFIGFGLRYGKYLCGVVVGVCFCLLLEGVYFFMLMVVVFCNFYVFFCGYVILVANMCFRMQLEGVQLFLILGYFVFFGGRDVCIVFAVLVFFYIFYFFFFCLGFVFELFVFYCFFGSDVFYGFFGLFLLF